MKYQAIIGNHKLLGHLLKIDKNTTDYFFLTHYVDL